MNLWPITLDKSMTISVTSPTWLLFVLLLAGCASDSAFRRADCQRYRYEKFNILACDDRAVGEHCQRICPRTDTGGPVDYLPRACYKPSAFGRRSTVFVGKSYMGCLPHELCHLDKPDAPDYCAAKYPCVGDKR